MGDIGVGEDMTWEISGWVRILHGRYRGGRGYDMRDIGVGEDITWEISGWERI